MRLAKNNKRICMTELHADFIYIMEYGKFSVYPQIHNLIT